LELGGPLSPEALGSLPTLPKVKAGTGYSSSKPESLALDSLSEMVIH